MLVTAIDFRLSRHLRVKDGGDSPDMLARQGSILHLIILLIFEFPILDHLFCPNGEIAADPDTIFRCSRIDVDLLPFSEDPYPGDCISSSQLRT